ATPGEIDARALDLRQGAQRPLDPADARGAVRVRHGELELAAAIAELAAQRQQRLLVGLDAGRVLGRKALGARCAAGHWTTASTVKRWLYSKGPCRVSGPMT